MINGIKRVCRLVVMMFVSLGGCFTHAEDQPNILWITAEDMSPVLGCYGDKYAITPNIDKLARESVRYTHAFASAPVCSPARSCLITGVYPPSLGTQQMRSAFPIPGYMKGFPSYLRRKGYYTTNNVKTDYNTGNWKEIIEASWNESSDVAHWRKREDKTKPFFSVFNLMTSHQSRAMVWPREKFEAEVQSKLSKDEIHDPKKAPIPAYYPNTSVIRETVARFYDCVTTMDKQVGAILKQLEEDGLAENTIVFFYADHGTGLPRHKRAVLDSGMHVPLLIKFPKKYAHLAPAKAGTSIDRLVSFVDFAPTVLSLTEIDVPKYMQGTAFLGKQNGEARDMVFGHRDRVDEVLDMARSVRTKRYLYIRNYHPELGYNQPTAWPDQGKVRHEFYRLAKRETMTDAQWHFAGPTRAAEELYDCVADPKNLKNLAESEQHANVLKRLRNQLRRQTIKIKDLGLIPESEAWDKFGKTAGYTYARKNKLDVTAWLDAAELVGKGNEGAYLVNLKSKDDTIAYWGAIGLAQLDKLSKDTVEVLKEKLQAGKGAVSVEAGNLLVKHGEGEMAMKVLIEKLGDENLSVVLHAARTIELLGEKAKVAIPAMRELLKRMEGIRPSDAPATVVQPGDEDMAMFIGFSANAFLNQFKDEDKQSHVGIRLFDGKSLKGWKPLVEGTVEVKDGNIELYSKGKNLWVLHEDTFGDFELTVEAKMPKSGYNSGIGFRCVAGKGKPKGYQCEVAEKESGMVYAIGSGWVYPKNKEERAAFFKTAGDAFKNSEWNKFRILCVGERIEIWVNGVKTTDIRDKRFKAGQIALQHHGKGDVHYFRNIKVKKLP